MKLFAISTLVLLAACTQSTPTETVPKELGFSYGDMMTGEEVSADRTTLDATILNRLSAASVEQQYAMAILAQASGDGILCDLLLTRTVLEEDSETTFVAAASAAQQACLNGGIEIGQMESEMLDLLEAQ